MINENMANEINKALEQDFPNTSKLGMKPAPGVNGGGITVTADIEALKRKLDTIAKGIALLKDQL